MKFAAVPNYDVSPAELLRHAEALRSGETKKAWLAVALVAGAGTAAFVAYKMYAKKKSPALAGYRRRKKR